MDSPNLAAWRELWEYRDVWIFSIALVVALPLLGYARFRRFVATRGAMLSTSGKLTLYARIAASQWLLVLAMLLILHRHGLTAADAGQNLHRPGLTVPMTAGLLATLAILTAVVLRRIRRSKPEDLAGALGKAKVMTPVSWREFAAFAVVCLTAGICEELLYRGWLVTLLWAVTRSPWVAVAIGAVCFGAGHAYQGIRGMVRTAIVGLQMGIFLVWTGSLIPGQVLHAGIDLMAGLASIAIAARNKVSDSII